MSSEQISEITTLTGPFANLRTSMEVWLWDLGPEDPVLPKAPDAPRGREGMPEFDLKVIQFQRALRDYKAALEQFERDEIAFKEFAKRYGGPVEVKFWSTDARDAIANDARAVADGKQSRPRWHLSARTRGYEKLPNAGLPKGMKPGHGHQANLERQIAGEKEFIAALKADPHFQLEVQG